MALMASSLMSDYQDFLVSDLTAKQLAQLDAGAFFECADAACFPPQGVPTLVQVFKLFKAVDGLLYLEMKGEPVTETFVARVAELIQEHQTGNKVIVESFDHDALRLMKRLAPEVRTAVLFKSRLRRVSSLSKQRILTAATAARADEIALHHTLVSSGLVSAATASGFQIVVWTVEHTKWIARAKDLGIKSLITNNPAKMLVHRI
jgi:glycerophosphoryl diester phosphodiesterase